MCPDEVIASLLSALSGCTFVVSGVGGGMAAVLSVRYLDVSRSVVASCLLALSRYALSDSDVCMLSLSVPSLAFDLASSLRSVLPMYTFHDSPVFQLCSLVGSDSSIPSTFDAGGLVVSYPVSSRPLQPSRVPCDALGLGLACWVATGHQWH